MFCRQSGAIFLVIPELRRPGATIGDAHGIFFKLIHSATQVAVPIGSAHGYSNQ
jgi:dTDP-4-dehydrorhamnose 3,5-epimerase-like enzyme